MPSPELTYELAIHFKPDDSGIETKELVKAELAHLGELTYVEGVIDDLYLDLNYEDPDYDYYAAEKGNYAPLLIYKFDEQALLGLKGKLESKFDQQIVCKMDSLSTQGWQEGWKENFKPFATDYFLVTPTWEKDPYPKDKIPLLIDPGMAFGTGQHETTRLCLREIESLKDRGAFKPEAKFLDLGTGSGILAIGAAKLGAKNIWATDIDPDSVMVAKTNAELNQVSLNVAHGGIPQGFQGGFDIVIANILTVILVKLMPDLARSLKSGGILILSGLLVEDEEQIMEAATPHGLRLTKRSSEKGWGCLVLELGHGA